MTTAPEIIQKIQKLLNLAARGGTEAESKSAFAAASRLMTQHGIEQHQLGVKQEASIQRTAMEGACTKTERPAHRYIRIIIRQCFNVEILKTPKWGPDGVVIGYALVGTKEDCLYASFVFEVLSDTFLRLLNDYLRSTGKPRTPFVYTSFFMGLAAGYTDAWKEAQSEKMKEQKAESYALVLVDKDRALTQFMAAQSDVVYRKTKPKKIDAAAYYGGVAKGRTLTVARPIA